MAFALVRGGVATRRLRPPMMSILIFAAGAALLIYSAEKLITYLVGAARGLAISVFLLAVIFTGIEFDDLVFGVALNLEGMEDVALGVVFGTVISMVGVVLALAALLVPCRVQVPRDYLVIFAASPLVLVALAFVGQIGTALAILLIALFVAFVAYVAVRERTRSVAVFRDSEVMEGAGNGGGGTLSDDVSRTGDMTLTSKRHLPGWALLGLAVLSLVGLVVGAWVMAEGTEGILEDFGIVGTVFGATIATLVLTLEDIFLTVEPARRGAPLIGVGNVIGSVVFSVTAKLGIIVLAGGAIEVGDDVFVWHLPALILLIGFSTYALWTGQLRRWHGVVLLVGYVLYWIVSFVVFGVVPADDD
ncbi:sodium/calcium exchanger protein [Pseudonocardia sp. Ae168_Ps1]|uniref:sodium:calcium antiporter n=1 Tax=unclassified Pseudonocardia TaxID=2619320 RepID=UPI00095A764D|nr:MULTISPECIES: sodium:proton exchanger [unclassified Pseudonocardia]OLL70885.1 sodium/calcium exchanger protein [Pseudonocardia sp. Ae168_Ps1]OLL77561.1 sodium/calcium exchanger protein [Pseudonocardia sp. Ae150A_Ps1]OLL88325.1 sodium/calcium exchanger protein [Pseudonocardia sp. Ae263_Ps1]OLL91651.1 sodium/calcium exchanger protein [Pseudonocardia sp. Ae356_Ps1]